MMCSKKQLRSRHRNFMVYRLKGVTASLRNLRDDISIMLRRYNVDSRITRKTYVYLDEAYIKASVVLDMLINNTKGDKADESDGLKKQKQAT